MNEIKDYIELNDVVAVFKKMAKKAGWKATKSYDSYYLETDITITVGKTKYYIAVDASNWRSGVSTHFRFDTKKFGFDGVSRIYYNSKIVKEWEVPCDFDDVDKADEYIQILRDFFAKKNALFNKRKNNVTNNYVMQRQTYKKFYSVMEDLADKYETKFTEDKNDLKKWYFDDVTISWSNKEKVWRLVVYNLNYSYFKCKDLNDIYDFIDWYENFPKTVKFSDKF
jgi:hypothetical protein